MKRAVLFDLGGTLAAYYERHEFPAILDRSLWAVSEYLRSSGAVPPDVETVRSRANAENHEAADYRVRPLAGRLSRIFGLEETPPPPDLEMALCRAFLGPIFAVAHLYDDSLPVLHRLRRLGMRLAIISNTPWGSPAAPWHDELARLGLAPAVDHAVFCSEVGWRKPDRRIFEQAMRGLGVEAADCLFVGDDPRWDAAGAAACGIDHLLIDRAASSTPSERTICDLEAVVDALT